MSGRAPPGKRAGANWTIGDWCANITEEPRRFMPVTMLRNLKDKAAEVVLKAFLNTKIQAYGSLKSLQIDSKAKMLRLELDLLGETSPVTVEAAYTLSRS